MLSGAIIDILLRVWTWFCIGSWTRFRLDILQYVLLSLSDTVMSYGESHLITRPFERDGQRPSPT